MSAPRAARATVVGLALAACSGATSDVPSVASVELSTATVNVVAGGTTPLTARLRDAAGNDVDGAVVWSARDPSIAAVTSSDVHTGVVRGLTPGSTQISANFAGHFAVATVAVTQAPVASVVVVPTTVDLRVGGTAQLQARTLDAAGAELTGRAIAYTTSAAGVATVSASGLVTGVAAGTATITAVSEERTALVTVTVTPVPVASITLTPAAPTVPLGATVQLQAVTLDSAGRTLTGRTVTWTSSDQSVAAVSSAGVATGTGVGTARITATSEGRSATATITVQARPVASVTISLPQADLAQGDTARLTVRLADAQGLTLTGRAVTFASDAPAVATVNATGLVTAVGPGSATLTATSENVRGTLAVRVTAVVVASVRVTPDTTRITSLGATARLTATPLSATGATITGRTVTWTSGAPQIVTVNANGVVTGLTPGVAVVFARVDGVVGQAAVVVSQPDVARIVVSPATASVAVGAGVTLTATPVDASGTPLTGRILVWSTSDASTAIVSSAGRVTGLRAGTATITAMSGTATGTATVTVTP